MAIVREAALRIQFGGREVAKAQLRYVLERSEQDDVTVLVIPFAAGAFPGAGQTVLYAERPVAQLDTVKVDSSHRPALLHAAAQLAKYRAHFGLDGAHRPLVRGITRLHPRDRQRLPRGRPMSDITREAPFCGEGNSCFRLGTDATGNAYVAMDGAEGSPSPTAGRRCGG